MSAKPAMCGWMSGVCWLLFLLMTGPASGAELKRVVLLYSFGRDYAPFDSFASEFRTQLIRGMPNALDIYEVSLESARLDSLPNEGPVAAYMESLFADRQPDLVVTIGGPAARFAQKNRAALFRDTPLLLAAVDERHLAIASMMPNDVAVPVRNDSVQVLENMLDLLPGTTNVVVVIGNSRLERFWLEELRSEFQRFTPRVSFQWMNELPFAAMVERCANLAPNSVIFFALLAVDRDGIPWVEYNALHRLHDTANAPIFGLHDTQLGNGIVGGPLMAIGVLSRKTAEVAIRILGGEPAADIKVPVQMAGPYVYDASELRRWRINASLLPPGSTVLFNEPTFWDRYRARIIVVTTILIAQALLIAALLVNRGRRLQAEREAKTFGGRLIQAQEAERARLARELHDDITQRLASLAIDAGRANLVAEEPERKGAMENVREGLARLSNDVHSLSYQLHPTILKDLGLVTALKSECAKFRQHEGIDVAVSVAEVPAGVPEEVGLCLFRVTQEAMRNAARHANTPAIEVSLRPVADGLQLAVADQGAGFNPDHRHRQPSLGLESMKERVRLLDGRLEIKSAPGAGTTIVAWVPINRQAAPDPGDAS